jgi:predicted short-subunit dehydrogenase-like oxidoreductase (DUF2520 family)
MQCRTKAFQYAEGLLYLNMKKRHLQNFAIIGTGMVGTAIGCLLRKVGYNVVAISDKSHAAMKRSLRYTGGRSFANPCDAVKNADCILITTPDDAIFSACEQVSFLPDIKGKFVLHMSGARGLDILEPAKQAGAFVASIHPLQSFSSIDQAIKNIPGSYFGVTAGKHDLSSVKNLIRNLGGIPMVISDAQKPLYHAAACYASNYLVTLLNAVESIYKSIGIREKDAKKAYMPLIYGCLKNVEKSGSVLSLTGPIARGDVGTVRKHLLAIR